MLRRQRQWSRRCSSKRKPASQDSQPDNPGIFFSSSHASGERGHKPQAISLRQIKDTTISFVVKLKMDCFRQSSGEQSTLTEVRRWGNEIAGESVYHHFHCIHIITPNPGPFEGILEWIALESTEAELHLQCGHKYAKSNKCIEGIAKLSPRISILLRSLSRFGPPADPGQDPGWT
jgi:hypothetical protein